MINPKYLPSTSGVSHRLSYSISTESNEPQLFDLNTVVHEKFGSPVKGHYFTHSDAANITYRIMVIVNRLQTLTEVVCSQHRIIEFNSHYIAYLLEQTTEEEFEKISEKFITAPQYMPPSKLKQKVQNLLSLTNISYSASELSDLFQCDEEAVDAVLKQLNPTYNFEA